MFVSIDAQGGEARGVRSVALSIVFMALLGLVTAMAVQMVGALLVLSVLVTPAAAALRVSRFPVASSSVVHALRCCRHGRRHHAGTGWVGSYQPLRHHDRVS